MMSFQEGNQSLSEFWVPKTELPLNPQVSKGLKTFACANVCDRSVTQFQEQTKNLLTDMGLEGKKEQRQTQ